MVFVEVFLSSTNKLRKDEYRLKERTNLDIMFDTNAFDKVIANFDIVINSSRENQYYITYVQKKELDKIPSIKQEKKDRLLK